jgi:hypothetical protein
VAGAVGSGAKKSEGGFHFRDARFLQRRPLISGRANRMFRYVELAGDAVFDTIAMPQQ